MSLNAREDVVRGGDMGYESGGGGSMGEGVGICVWDGRRWWGGLGCLLPRPLILPLFLSLFPLPASLSIQLRFQFRFSSQGSRKETLSGLGSGR